MSYDKLPLGLKFGNYFCLYQLEPGNDGKKKQVLYRVKGARADLGNKAHFTDITTVYETYSKGGYEGIGLSVMEDIVLVNIDECIADGKLNDFTQEIAYKLGTYVEFNPSGTGDHICGRAPNIQYDAVHYYMNNRKVSLEVYIGGHATRFITLIGKVKLAMNPKTLQYLMGHSGVSVTMNIYTHISFDDAEEELKRMEEFRKA